MAFLAPAIAAISSAWAASGAAAFLTQTIVGRLLVSVATSALLQALNKPPTTSSQGGGISTSVTLTGGTNPLSFVMGRYATNGVFVCPPMSHGKIDKTPLAYLTYVIALGAVKGCTLDSVIIDDQPATLGNPVHPDYGQSVQGDYLGYAWVKYYDGSQTVADPGLIAKYGSYPHRPWSSDMIGAGIPYAIVTFRFNNELWPGGAFPEVRFVMNSIPLYDIRKDSTAGGSGAHRWANPATWEPSENTFVHIYNIKRGITLFEGSVWGGNIAANDLDTASWIAAMNECDVAVTKAGGGTEAQFRTAFEVKVNQKPADVITVFNRGCSGQVAEVGGRWKARAGGPGLPVYFFSDADTLVTKPQDFRPFPGLEASFNGVTAEYPDPDALWETKAAPPRYNATYEAQDQGRRRVAALDLPAVPYSSQVQRLMKAYIEDERRFRRHGLTLPPDAAILEPLDAAAWTSAENGYASKLFEVTAVTDDLRTVIQRVSLRERDPSDYSYDSGMFLPSVPTTVGQVRPGIQTAAGFSVVGISLPDAAGIPRRPTLQILWDGIEQDDVRAVRWRVRIKATGVEVANGSTHDVDKGSLIVPQTLLASTEYEAQIRFVADRRTAWTGWLSATTPAVFIGARDFAGGVIPAVDLSGVLSIANFASNIRPVEVLATLPATGNFEGRMVLLTSDDKLYRHTGSPSGAAGFTSAVPAADVTGQLTNAQIADLAAAKLTGQITNTQISDNAISTPKLAAGSVTTAKLVANAVTANEIAANTITAAEIAANAITASELSAGAVTAAKIAANTITAGQIAAGAIGATEIAADAIIASKIAVSDFTNCVPDSNLQDQGSWTTGTGGEFELFPSTSFPASSKGTIRWTGSPGTGIRFNQSKRWECKQNKQYWAGFQVRRTSGTQMASYASIVWYDKDGGAIGSSVSIDVTGVNTASGTQDRSEAVTAPAGAVEAVMRFVVNANLTDGFVQFFAPEFRLKNGGELLVDGSVTAATIAANAVVASKIAANAIDASKIVTGTLIQDLFASGQLQTALYPIGIDFITASDASWSPRFAGLMQVWVFGAGGGGGGATDSTNQSSGSGGGAGGLSIGFIPQATTAQTYAITIGAGGNGGTPAAGDNVANGTAGSLSRFTGNGFTFTGNGGGFGRGARNTSVLQAGGIGGTASGGSYNLQGGDGGDCTNTSSNRPAATGGGAPYVRTTATGNAADLVGNDTATGGGRSVPSSIPATTDVSGFMFQGYDTWIGGAGAVATLSSANGGTAPRACGGGGAACKRATAGGERGFGGPGGDGLVCVVYYGVGNFV